MPSLSAPVCISGTLSTRPWPSFTSHVPVAATEGMFQGACAGAIPERLDWQCQSLDAGALSQEPQEGGLPRAGPLQGPGRAR